MSFATLAGQMETEEAFARPAPSKLLQKFVGIIIIGEEQVQTQTRNKKQDCDARLLCCGVRREVPVPCARLLVLAPLATPAMASQPVLDRDGGQRRLAEAQVSRPRLRQRPGLPAAPAWTEDPHVAPQHRSRASFRSSLGTLVVTARPDVDERAVP